MYYSPVQEWFVEITCYYKREENEKRGESSAKAFPLKSFQLLVSSQSNAELELGLKLPLHFI